MRLFRSTLATGAALCAITTGIVLLQPPQPAHASASDREGGARGFRDHADNAGGDTDKPADVSLGSVRITAWSAAPTGGRAR
ncbi:hypothetical protein [Streptomyces sp. NPDC050121]|uniref:hypothetical protein n=1 Tax=Streptomyces sp. NPDC050121 TaxID=3365601 RepID=UPI0037AAF905